MRDSAVKHDEFAKRMYEETGNSYWVLYSVFHKTAFDPESFESSDWATIALKLAVLSAFAKHENGADLSLDKQLGLKPRRGRSPAVKRAAIHEKTMRALKFAETIHALYDVSKEVACEIIFHSVDLEHARKTEVREQHYAFDGIMKHLSGIRAAAAEYHQGSKWQKRRKEIWSATFENTLGFSLETFIAKAHRSKPRAWDFEDDRNLTNDDMPTDLGLSRWRGIDPHTLPVRVKSQAKTATTK
jgi:hypothetical protein